MTEALAEPDRRSGGFGLDEMLRSLKILWWPRVWCVCACGAGRQWLSGGGAGLSGAATLCAFVLFTLRTVTTNTQYSGPVVRRRISFSHNISDFVELRLFCVYYA